MRHLKRIVAFVAVLAMSVSSVGTVYAASGSNGPQASPTLTSYGVWLKPGTTKGELRVSFDVTATDKADSLGVSYFEIHRASNDELVETVRGTTSNGLKSSGFSYAHTYSYDGTSGMACYAIVAIYAEIDGIFDSRTLRTPVVTVP